MTIRGANALEKYKNVFYNNSSSINVLVYTADFIDDSDTIIYFRNANKIKGINIYFMPLLSGKKLEAVDQGSYLCIREGAINKIVVKFKDYQSNAVFMHPFDDCSVWDEQKIFELAEKNIINGGINSDKFDYIVVKQKNNVKQAHIPAISASQCADILRLFLVQRKWFFVSESYKIDETSYYIYKHKQIFYEFQSYWNAVCASEVIDEWADALDNRLTMVTICLDNCKIEAYKPQNNITSMHLKYHFSYLLLLITGIMDNIAWIINTQYELKLDKRQVDLRGKNFKEKIKDQSKAIFDILNDNIVNAFVNAVRELRDRVVHREFIKTITCGKSDNSVPKTIRLYLDIDMYKVLENAGFEIQSLDFRTKDSVVVNIIDIILFLEKNIVNLVNNLLKIISDEVYKSNENIEVWKLLKFNIKPYVL